MNQHDFIQAYINFTATALTCLRNKYPLNKGPFRGFIKSVFYKKGGYTSYTGTHLDIVGIIGNEWKYIYELPEFTKLQITFPFEKHDNTKHELFSPFCEYIQQKGTLIYDKNKLLKIISFYLQMWNSSSLEFITRCFINGIQLKEP